MRHNYLLTPLFTSIFLLVLLSLLFLSACSTNNVYDIDSARQIAVNNIMEDDTYTQYDGYDFKELLAEKSTCDTCYKFVYTFNTTPEYLPEISGYVAEISIRENKVVDIKYVEIPSADTVSYVTDSTSSSDNIYHSTPISDRFDKFCKNKCGDGYCDDIVCQDVDCTCEESKDNCPEDC